MAERHWQGDYLSCDGLFLIPAGSGLDISTVSASGFHLNVYRGRSLECGDITSPFKFNFLGKRFSLCRKKEKMGQSHFLCILLFFSAG